VRSFGVERSLERACVGNDAARTAEASAEKHFLLEEKEGKIRIKLCAGETLSSKKVRGTCQRREISLTPSSGRRICALEQVVC